MDQFKAILKCKDPVKARKLYFALDKQVQRDFIRANYKGLIVRHEVRRHQYLFMSPLKFVYGKHYITIYPKIGNTVIGFQLLEEFEKQPTSDQILKAIKAELPSVRAL